jgi:3',5'-cyclic AMP phosphodiesterase CpdA
MLDSESDDRGFREAEIAWLKRDLAAARASDDVRWIVACVHHPPYGWGDHDADDPKEDEMRFVRSHLVPIFDEGGVDLVLAAHQHYYARSELLRGYVGRADSLSPAMVVDRGGGEGRPIVKSRGTIPNGGVVYVTVGSSSKLDRTAKLHPASALKLHEYGSLLVAVEGDRLEGRFVARGGDVLDRFVIEKRGAAPSAGGAE